MNLVQIYTVSLILLFFVFIGMCISDSDNKMLKNTVFELLIFTPIFGRILGWW